MHVEVYVSRVVGIEVGWNRLYTHAFPTRHLDPRQPFIAVVVVTVVAVMMCFIPALELGRRRRRRRNASGGGASGGSGIDCVRLAREGSA